MTGGTVRATVAGPIATLIIDHPERRNAMSLGMYAAIPYAVETIARASEVRVVILRGAGEIAFGAGSDISEFATRRNATTAAQYNQIEEHAAAAIESIAVPVLALIHGPCLGGGAGIALCADLRFAADDATFAIPAAKLGVGYPLASTARLVVAVGPARAKDLIFSGRVLDAAEALRIGLIDAVLPKADLDTHVEAYAEQITRNAPLTIAAAKLAIAGGAPGRAEAAIAACYASADYADGIAAFGEKRRPRFSGR